MQKKILGGCKSKVVASNCLQHEFDLDITKYLTFDLILGSSMGTAITKCFTFDLIFGTVASCHHWHRQVCRRVTSKDAGEQLSIPETNLLYPY